MVYVIDGENVEFAAGSAAVLPSKTQRTRIDSHCDEVEYISFNFHTDMPLCLPAKIDNCITDEAYGLLNVFESLYNGHSKHREKMYLMVFGTLLLVLEDIVSLNAQTPHVDRILSYIDSHFTEKIKLTDIAQAVHLAPSYCCNLIKKELGVTVLDIVTEKRMELARDLL